MSKETANSTVRMPQADLDHFEALLKEKRATLVEEITTIEQNNLRQNQKDQGGELSGYTTHPADAASDYESLVTNLDLADRTSKYLKHIETALKRIEAGTFGVCKVCGKLIPRARLEVVPTATKCVNCKEETKKKEAEEERLAQIRAYASTPNIEEPEDA
jgi:RNA polymerase-binding protein DksA